MLKVRRFIYAFEYGPGIKFWSSFNGRGKSCTFERCRPTRVQKGNESYTTGAMLFMARKEIVEYDVGISADLL